MYKRTVIQLLALKLSGEATQEDLDELEQLILEKPDTVYHDEVLKELFQKKDEQGDVEQYYNRHRLKYQNKLQFAEDTIPVSIKSGSTKLFFAVGSLFLIFSIGLLFFLKSNQEDSSDLNAKITSGEKIRKNIVLPDGTKVYLNSNSELLYDKDMNTKSVRSVMLIGEAFFDVSHNKSRPFIINTNKISIKVLGTAFNLKAYPEDVETQATLLRGSIELSVKNRNVKSVRLKPSQKFALIDNCTNNITPSMSMPATGVRIKVENTSPVQVAGKVYAEEVAWIENKLVFRNQSLREMKPQLERWFNIKLEIKNEDINSFHFTGVFTDENLTQALTSLKIIRPFNFKINKHDVIIY
jgi:ferric-dicitrate binding protein FerR (iron transport regulator)